MHIMAMAINPLTLLFNGFILGDTYTNTYTKLSDKNAPYIFLGSLLWKSQHSWSVFFFFLQQNWNLFRRMNCSELWTPKTVWKKVIIIRCDIEAFCTAFLTLLWSLLPPSPPTSPSHLLPSPPLLDIPFVAKQYLAKTLRTSRECICCKATIAYLKC